MDFVKDWPQFALEGEASHYLKKYNVLDDISEQTRYVKRHLSQELNKASSQCFEYFYVTCKIFLNLRKTVIKLIRKHKNERNSSNVREMVQLEDDKFVQELQISHLKALGWFLI